MSTDRPDSPALADLAWQQLAQAETAAQWFQAWLAVLGQALTEAEASLLLLAQPDGSYAPVAAHPADRDPGDLSDLGDIATEALRQREGQVRRDERGHARLAYPLQAHGQLYGAVVLDLGQADEATLAQALRLTHWGAGWLIELLGQAQRPAGAAPAGTDGHRLLDTLLAMLAEGSLRETALALVNRLGRELDCPQVQLGLARRRTVRVLAVSHAAWFDERSEAVSLAAQAMHEALDQSQRLAWPADADDPSRVTSALRRHAESTGAAVVLSLPLASATEVVGVLLLERARPFDAAELAWLDTLAAALAPLLLLRQEAERGLVGRAGRQMQRAAGWLSGSAHPAVKLGLGVAGLALLGLAVVPVSYRVSAPALVEGAVQRAAVAPFEGYLREAPARAGDAVKAGQVLAVLDDKDLQLERVRWDSELEVALRKESEAMATGNRVDQRLAAAQANQARAQLDLVLGRLDRVQVLAPFDGVVVKGDLSQLLGSPLEQGKVLFELAPLDAWRVVLKVDERDIGRVAVGATGELVLASLPGQAWPFTVSKLTPVSVAEGGSNHFRVEAALTGTAPKLSPNMEGVAKVQAGRASLLWIWTHRSTDWLRLAWWKWMP